MKKLLTIFLYLVVFSTIGCGGVESSATADKTSVASPDDSPQIATMFEFSFGSTSLPDGYDFALNVTDQSLRTLVDKLFTQKKTRLTRPIRLVCESAESERSLTFNLEVSGSWMELLHAVAKKYGCTVQNTDAEILIQDGIQAGMGKPPGAAG